MDDTTVKKDVISALVDAFDDKSENVREQAIKSISVIGLKHPGLTADTLLNIRRKNAALLTDRTRHCLWTCLCKMIPEKDFKSNISSETVEELLSASVTDSRRRGDSGQLARHFLVLSVSNFGEDSYHVVINSLQSKADIQLMCTLSQMLTNPAKLRASTFDKTLDVLLSLMPTMKHSEEKIVVAKIVWKVAKALKEFSVADERPTSNGNASEVEEEICLNDYTHHYNYRGKLDKCNQYILSNWLGRSRLSKGLVLSCFAM